MASDKVVLGRLPLGVQLWTVNAELRKDAPGTLASIKRHRL